MSPSVRDEETGQLLSTRTCESCRQRKIKCSRELPRCVICERSSKECTYPERVLKPGPKLGSSQGQRKRRRESAGDQLFDASSKALRRTSNSSHQSNHNNEDSIVPTSSTQHPNDIQTLSFIIHPSHESCSPEQHHETVMSAAPPVDDETLVSLSCYTLGMEPGYLKHL